MRLSEKIQSCSNSFDDKRKTFYDPKAKSDSNYKVENNSNRKFSIIRFDDCVFDSKDTKCDYGMQIENDNAIHFIELKGSDNHQGLKQIYETILNTKAIFKDNAIKIRLIVSKAEAPRNLNQGLIDKIGEITRDRMNGKKKTFIKTNNTFTEHIN